MALELYHNDMSTCAQKVRLTLTEKCLDWTSHHMDLRKGDTRTDEYKKLNPNAVVPTLIDKGTVICESTVIMEYLEDAYPQTSLRPKDPIECARMRTWTKQLDENLKAIDHKELIDDSIMDRIDKILKNKPSPEQDML